MTILAENLASRRLVWAQLSELYLDTETGDSLQSVARALAGSDYSMAELRVILFDEVHPVLRANLTVAGGVWDAFDQEWLAGRIMQRMARPPWLRVPGWFLSGVAKTIWNDLAARVERIRNDPSFADSSRSVS
ncbi:MAG TPA: hypothetical protein VFN25_07305 [Dokdonella sp.]|uniref:DUF7079 family protein n=1 Tax=Dokdonella sp. TaxID=2291710 RepID=UPI002D7F7E2A|nr:hypothetical protein [Dokdonella sp.]HET9032697.1 hypothetical protein [Dokdonella sp.]